MAVVASTSSLYQAVDQLTGSASEPLHLEKHRDAFHEKVLKDVTISSNNGLDSAMMADPSNPLAVKEDMELQKDQFRRLKFNHLEYAAKRDFLFVITGDEPARVSQEENESLERSNAEKKAMLKHTKGEINQMVSQAKDMAKETAAKNIEMRKNLSKAQSLQKSIRDAELELARIRAKHPLETRMTINQAENILDKQVEDLQTAEEQVTEAKARAESLREEVSRTAKEVQRLNREKEREEARAKEVQDGREAGDTKVDELCQWLNSSIALYKTIMGIRSVKATTQKASHLLHLEYDVPPTSVNLAASQSRKKGQPNTVTLVLEFEDSTRRLMEAQLIGSEMHIDEAKDVAVRSQDIPGLIGDVLVRLRGV